MSDRRAHVKISRRFFEDEDWWLEKRRFSKAEAWIDCIQMASWRPRRYLIGLEAQRLERGEFVASLRFLAKRWRWSKDAVWDYMNALEKRRQLVRQREGQGGTVYLLVNYDYYQSNPQEDETPSETPKATPERHLSDKTEAVKQLKQEKQTWLTPFADTWKRTLGNPPFGRLAKALKPVVDELGGLEALDRWSRYLAGNEPKYCSPERFAATHALYAGPEVQEMTDEYGRMVPHRKNRDSGQWEPIVA